MNVKTFVCCAIPVFLIMLGSCNSISTEPKHSTITEKEAINALFPESVKPESFRSVNLKSNEIPSALPVEVSTLFQSGKNRDETTFYPKGRYGVDTQYDIYHIYIMDEGWTSDWLYIYNKVNGIFENQPIMVSGKDNDDDQWFIRTSKMQDINKDRKTDLIISDHVSYVVTDSLPAESDLKVADTLIWNNGFR